jgi:hypothetical protein
MHAGEEQLLAGDGDALMEDAHIADVAAGAGGTDGLHQRLVCADRLDDRVRTQPISELDDLLRCIHAVGSRRTMGQQRRGFERG